jgi:hypothetical protein
MDETEWQQRYREEARTLGELGWAFACSKLPRVEVRLPRALAEKAVAAWERDGDEGPPAPEDHEQRVQRHRAATLSLIGLSITNCGRWESDAVVVELSPDLIGNAVNASDDLPSRESISDAQ